MAAQSDNKYDVFTWIMKVYDSCETVSQMITTEKLIRNFYKMYNDRTLYVQLDDYYFEVSERLQQKLDKKTRKKLLKG
jgi:hypothetical protein